MSIAPIVIAGSSGFVGRALCDFLHKQGKPFVRLVRREPLADNESFWQPENDVVDTALFAAATTIINLAGAGIADALWSKRRRQVILNSRIQSTRTLVTAINKHALQPCRLLNASGLGYYGSRDDVCTEDAGLGDGFLAEVCSAWEAPLEHLDETSGHSAVAMRLGMVLGADGGALSKMLPPMRFGLGGRLGSGKQWLSWVSQRDVVRVISYLMSHADITGAVNVCAPEALQNDAFMRSLAEVLGKPYWAHVPGFILRLRFGQMANELLLGSSRACPNVLQSHGFEFADSDLKQCLQNILE